MSKNAVIALRSILVAVLAGGCAYVIIWLLFPFPLKTHTWILGVMAGVFGISDAHFRSLITELNAVMRRAGYSVQQAHDIAQVVEPLRTKIWSLWHWSQGMKLAAGIAGITFQFENVGFAVSCAVLIAAYSLIFLSLILSYWAKRNFAALERRVDELSMIELKIKEKKRLKAEIEGKPHDFSNDETMMGYTKPPVSIAPHRIETTKQ